MKLKEIKDLIELVSEKGFAEFEIERQGFRLRISRFKEAPAQLIQQAPTPVIISSGIPSTAEVLSSGTQRGLIEGRTSNAGQGPSVETERGDRGAAEAQPELHVINSPIVGTFFRAASPTSEPFVKIGDHVEPDSVVCIIEAMKLMNEIQAEVGGVIAEIYVENAQPVEYGQALFGVRA